MLFHPFATAEMAFFDQLVRAGRLSAAARELGVTLPAVSKRLSQLEARLGVTLLDRTTRRMALTPAGETYVVRARRILGEIDDLEQSLSSDARAPRGLLRVNATPGFGRSHVGPLISSFVKGCPDVHVQLQLLPEPPSPEADAYDVCVRFGEPSDSRLIARRIAPNRRLLCASPTYLARHGHPRVPADLAQHSCIGIFLEEQAYTVWRLSKGRQVEEVKVRGNLSTGDGETAVNWALAGHGIVLRAEWDIAKYLRSGRLRPVLEDWQAPPADIHAVFTQRHHEAARVRRFVEFLVKSFEGVDPGERGFLKGRW
jgi:DNA-binding transcriptional LysR family regulator